MEATALAAPPLPIADDAIASFFGVTVDRLATLARFSELHPGAIEAIARDMADRDGLLATSNLVTGSASVTELAGQLTG